MIKTIGILGGGQLGRMTALAAARLGIKTIIYCPEKNSPASQIAYKTITAEYTDESSLIAFSDEVDAVTYEFENIPASALRTIQSTKNVFPRKDILEISQNRITEKTWLKEKGFDVARWKTVKTPYEVHQTMQMLGFDGAVLKIAEQGYDGKGQAFINIKEDVESAWDTISKNEEDIIIEEKIDFECEISVIVARDQFKNIGTYAPSLNTHENHILKSTIIPAPIPQSITHQAQILASELAEHLILVGVIGVEFFLTKDGRLLINEIAPRPHNSGHWTIDACYCSQFEQHVRAVSGLPLGSFDHHHNAEMQNLIGQDVDDIAPPQRDSTSILHIYGKDEAREGRKMGHITHLKPLD